MKRLICVLLCAAFVCGTVREAEGQDEMFAEEVRVSRNTAVVLSVLFPGLGQMASGQKRKGGALFLGELVSLIVAVDGHESYNTRRDVYATSRSEYEDLRVGGSHQEAEARWRRLVDLNDDLDNLHRRRQIFGYAAAAIYAVNLVDILFWQSGDAAAAREVDARPRVSLAPVGGTTGIVISKGF